ncbi:MAG: flagellar hook assembly protein FlgD [Parvularculaceae bacterium]
MDIAALSSAQIPQSSTSAFSRLTDNFDTFLTLLTTQLRNQDPLEPLDTERFTDQLVQFASVEQSIRTNRNLEALIAIQAAATRETALDYVGRVATVEGGEAGLGADGARWRYVLPTNAKSVALTVFDASGAVVARTEGETGAGAHTVVWDGLADNGAPAAPGVYRLVIEAQDANGDALPVALQSAARVSGVVFNDGSPLLKLDGRLVPIDDISAIHTDFNL